MRECVRRGLTWRLCSVSRGGVVVGVASRYRNIVCFKILREPGWRENLGENRT